jgi:CheY-like chemotaxis protein
MPGAARARTALVVEDEALVRCDIVESLQSDGWHVLETASGEMAIDFLAQHHVDVVFTDIQLAGVLSGWEVAEIARKVHPDIHVIYASGNAPDRQRQLEGTVFFDKPYMPDRVLATCRKCIEE